MASTPPGYNSGLVLIFREPQTEHFMCLPTSGTGVLAGSGTGTDACLSTQCIERLGKFVRCQRAFLRGLGRPIISVRKFCEVELGPWRRLKRVRAKVDHAEGGVAAGHEAGLGDDHRYVAAVQAVRANCDQSPAMPLSPMDRHAAINRSSVRGVMCRKSASGETVAGMGAGVRCCQKPPN